MFLFAQKVFGLTTERVIEDGFSFLLFVGVLAFFWFYFRHRAREAARNRAQASNIRGWQSKPAGPGSSSGKAA